MARKNSKATATKKQQQAGDEEGFEEDGIDDTASASSTSSSEAEVEEASSDDNDEHGGESGSGSDAEEGSERSANDDDDDDGSSSDEDAADADKEEGLRNRSSDGSGSSQPAHAGDEHCTFDLANLLAFNTHQINAAELYRAVDATGVHPEWYAASPTIATATATMANESFLLSKAAEGTTQLLAELWRLPTEKTEVGPMAKLHSGGETKLPRSLPPPPPKQLSKWEQFALQRGIAPKSKRSRKVFDEATGEWKHLTGSLENKANAGPESWPIIEVKKNDDPMADPWEKMREEKKSRVNKNVESRMRNAERAGNLEKGSANKLVKNNARLEKQRELARARDRERGLIAPAGVPVDVKSDAKRGKPSTQLALRATQISTASLGRFDGLREGEPERKKMLAKAIHGNKKRRADDGGGGTNKKFLQGEAQKSVDILKKVMDGGSASKEKERDVKRGKYAKGETAYDYEFDDGLGAGSFKKKKGRAGMGKMKKMTKKRMK